MLSRRAALGTVLAGAAGGLAGGSAEARPNVSRFVSMPDFFNGDVADLSRLPTWDGGLNSINDSWRAATDHVLGVVASHRPQAVLVAGDMVEGRWNIDSDDRRLFGPVSSGTDLLSLAQCESAIAAAGATYYGHYRDLFASRGLTLYGALGDHELLDDRGGAMDNRWPVSGRTQKRGEPDNRYWLVEQCKEVWADHFTRTTLGRSRFRDRPTGTPAEGTAYATRIGPHLTLVTVDVFTKTRRGVEIGVFGDQLDWMRAAISSAKARDDVVIVQGHVPILAPHRSWISGDLRVIGGRRSPLYRALSECGADFYFCGEVHDTTVVQKAAGAPVQVSHGCIFRYGSNYLVGEVHRDGTTVLDYHDIPLLSASAEKRLWSTDSGKWQRTELHYGEPVRRGRLVVREGRILHRSRKLGRYDPTDDPWSAAALNRTRLY